MGGLILRLAARAGGHIETYTYADNGTMTTT